MIPIEPFQSRDTVERSQRYLKDVVEIQLRASEKTTDSSTLSLKTLSMKKWTPSSWN